MDKRRLFLPGICVMGLAVSSNARAEFGHQEVVFESTASEWPIGALVRQWETTDDVFIAIEVVDDSGLHNVRFQWWTCSDGDGCDTTTLEDSEILTEANDLVLKDVFERARHPSMGISKAGPSAPVRLWLTQRDKYWQDCDGDTLDYDERDPTDVENLGLSLATYSTDTESFGGAYLYASAGGDNEGTTCDNHRRSFTRRLNGETHYCYERLAEGDDTNDEWFPECDYDHTHEAPVPNVILGRNPAPGFDFYNGHRMLAYAGGASTGPDITLTVVDVDGGVNPAGANFTPGINQYVGTPFVTYASDIDRLAVVWSSWGTGVDPTIQYSACTNGFCDDPWSDTWEAASEVTDDAWVTGSTGAFPQIAHDGEREVVLYQGQGPGLFTTSRCLGGSWSAPEAVRIAPDDIDVQTINIGTPNLVLNRIENIGHVVFVETDDSDPESARVVHAWRSYPDCP